MDSRIPSTYKNIELDQDARAALRMGWMLWRRLSGAMQRSLIDCWPRGDRDLRAHLRFQTLEALHRRGLCDSIGHRLTGLGQLVREAGTRAAA